MFKGNIMAMTKSTEEELPANTERRKMHIVQMFRLKS